MACPKCNGTGRFPVQIEGRESSFKRLCECKNGEREALYSTLRLFLNRRRLRDEPPPSALWAGHETTNFLEEGIKFVVCEKVLPGAALGMPVRASTMGIPMRYDPKMPPGIIRWELPSGAVVEQDTGWRPGP